MNPIFCTGMLVLCLNDDEATEHVKKDRLYLVSAVMQRGRFLQLDGVQMLMAASRFVPARFGSGDSDVSDPPKRTVANAGY